ncbi:MAG: hypothetical protein JO016_10140, partial [Actinobacteria bacterium]|nr:hypothetical protein [Actinomycetota bacterium]
APPQPTEDLQPPDLASMPRRRRTLGPANTPTPGHSAPRGAQAEEFTQAAPDLLRRVLEGLRRLS